MKAKPYSNSVKSSAWAPKCLESNGLFCGRMESKSAESSVMIETWIVKFPRETLCICCLQYTKLVGLLGSGQLHTTLYQPIVLARPIC